MVVVEEVQLLLPLDEASVYENHERTAVASSAIEF